MKKNVLLFALLVGWVVSLSAQVTLKGKISNIPPSALQVALLDYWSVDRWQQLGILQLENGGTFSTKVAPPNQAQCRIRMASQPKVWSDFLLPGPGEPSDSVLQLDLDMRLMNGGPAQVSGYAENDLYFSLMSDYKNLGLLHDSSSTATPAQLKEAERSFDKRCVDMAKQHPNTFTGDVVANLLYQPQKEDYPKDPKVPGMSANAFAIAHDLDKIPFRYDKALNHIGFVKALNRYYNYFDHTSEEGGKNYIEGIMSRRNGSDVVDVYLFKYLLDKMLDNKDENGLQYLLKWYLPDCSDESPLADYTKTLIEALQTCEPGKIAPEVQLPGVDGKLVSLNEVCAKNKMTILFFWRSSCSHCKEFKPILEGFYEKYHPMGLEIYAISLDKTDASWKKELEIDPTHWIDVFIPMEKRQALTKQFPVPATPTLISLDSNRKVLRRLILRSHLESYLQEELNR